VLKGVETMMEFFPARILSRDGAVVADDVEIMLHFFRFGEEEKWGGSFEVPATTAMTQHIYRIQLTNGRTGFMRVLATQRRGNNLAVYYEGAGTFV